MTPTALVGRVCAALVAIGSALPGVAHGAEPARSLFQFDGASGYAPGAGVIVNQHGTIFGTTSIGETCPHRRRRVRHGLRARAATAGQLGVGVLQAGPFPGRPGTASSPYAQLTLGPAGSVVGCTTGGTPGTVWQLVPPTTAGDPWEFRILYVFTGKADGNLEAVDAPLILHGGALYGIASGGAPKACGQSGCGSVFRLVLRRRREQLDRGDAVPLHRRPHRRRADLDRGPRCRGGAGRSTGLGHGAVVRLAPPDATGGGWTESVATRFAGGDDGDLPGNLVLANGTLVRPRDRASHRHRLRARTAGRRRHDMDAHADRRHRRSWLRPDVVAPGAGGTLIGAIEGDFDFLPAACSGWSRPRSAACGPSPNSGISIAARTATRSMS